MATRSASHAGSWYAENPSVLAAEVEAMMTKASTIPKQSLPSTQLLGLICPHAGIRYSGPIAAFGYKILQDYLMNSENASNLRRVFLLGPSHHEYLDNTCLVSGAATYATPYGPIKVDTDVATALKLPKMNSSVDTEEHSLEMQMPFLAKILLSYAPHAKIVPVLVGSMSQTAETQFSTLFRPYWDSVNGENLFIFSSDFCHWGSRFRYEYHYKPESYPNIGDAIIAMDHEGIQHIESKTPTTWWEYMARTRNTICGRHPIGIMLQMLQGGLGTSATVKFVGYGQSNKCAGPRDSSVSYACGCVWR
eukprot:PhF_6_TR19199/c0_g1_i1/m.28231/K06990/MEMO1; MEMO1 family protein